MRKAPGQLKFTGTTALKKNLDILRTKRGPVAYSIAVLRGLLDIEKNSYNRTPYLTGFLRGSGIGKAKITKSDSSGAKGLTHNTASYAVSVHERTDIKRRYGEPKFLENAVKEVAPKIEKLFGVELKTRVFTKDMA